MGGRYCRRLELLLASSAAVHLSRSSIQATDDRADTEQVHLDHQALRWHRQGPRSHQEPSGREKDGLNGVQRRGTVVQLSCRALELPRRYRQRLYTCGAVGHAAGPESLLRSCDQQRPVHTSASLRKPRNHQSNDKQSSIHRKFDWWSTSEWIEPYQEHGISHYSQENWAQTWGKKATIDRKRGNCAANQVSLRSRLKQFAANSLIYSYTAYKAAGKVIHGPEDQRQK